MNVDALRQHTGRTTMAHIFVELDTPMTQFAQTFCSFLIQKSAGSGPSAK